MRRHRHSLPLSSMRNPALPWRGALLAVVGLTWLVSCSGAPVKPTAKPIPPESAATPARDWVASPIFTESEIRKLDPKIYSARFRRPTFCEQAARALRPASAAKAWEALSACIDKGDFKLLDRLLENAWLEDLRTRPDAPGLVAKVIAARGGDDARDGAMLRDRQVPFFALETAMKQPGAFRGRWLLLRARVNAIDQSSTEITIRLLAQGTAHPSGLRAVGRLQRIDPILRRGAELVFVARFEGLAEKPGEAASSGEPIAVLSMISYAEPVAAAVE